MPCLTTPPPWLPTCLCCAALLLLSRSDQAVYLQQYDQGSLLKQAVLRVAEKDVRKVTQKKEGKKKGERSMSGGDGGMSSGAEQARAALQEGGGPFLEHNSVAASI